MKEDTVVIATLDCQRALYVIAKSAMVCDRIEIHYVNKYAPTVEYLLRMLRKGFGWSETYREMKSVTNNKCEFNVDGFCTNKAVGEKIACKEQIRAHCDHYKQRFNTTITVNAIIIEKAGGIRGMD